MAADPALFGASAIAGHDRARLQLPPGHGFAACFAILAAMNSAPRFRLLHLEDAEADHALAMATLRRSGIDAEVLRVEVRADFEAALPQGWDLVLSDYHLPGFTGLDALTLVREHPLAAVRATPFILVSGQIGEDTAVQAMRNGAADYLLKQNLSRLAPAVEHAIEGARTRAARSAADAEVLRSREQLQALAQHLQTSIEAERAAIAREIHDDVGGSLTALKFELDWLRRHAPVPAVPEFDARVQMALETVTQAIESSQRIMQNLRPAILEQGLEAALQWLCARFTKRTGTPCEYRGGLGPAAGGAADAGGAAVAALPPGVALVAYRSAQEALTNISKHAQAGRVTVDLALLAGVLSLEISDDGRGLAATDLAKARSFGIRGLQERAATVGGWVELGSVAGKGATLILSVPVAAPAGACTATRDQQPGSPR